jgi:hypothetical protein
VPRDPRAACCTLLGPPPPPPPPPPNPALLARALAELPTRPSVAAVQEAALRRATLAPRTAERWLRRARAAALLPEVQIGLDLRNDQGWQLDQAADDGDELSQDLGAGRNLQLRASWDLDRLIFNPDELRAARAALDLADVRERLLVRVTQLYFERQQLLLEIASLPARDGREAIGRHVRLAEVEAVLVGLTGLRFPRPGANGDDAKLRSNGP